MKLANVIILSGLLTANFAAANCNVTYDIVGGLNNPWTESDKLARPLRLASETKGYKVNFQNFGINDDYSPSIPRSGNIIRIVAVSGNALQGNGGITNYNSTLYQDGNYVTSESFTKSTAAEEIAKQLPVCD